MKAVHTFIPSPPETVQTRSSHVPKPRRLLERRPYAVEDHLGLQTRRRLVGRVRETAARLATRAKWGMGRFHPHLPGHTPHGFSTTALHRMLRAGNWRVRLEGKRLLFGEFCLNGKNIGNRRGAREGGKGRGWGGARGGGERGGNDVFGNCLHGTQ